MTEPRIVYVTGMKPKPPPEEHRPALLRALGAGLARHRPSWAGYFEHHAGQFTLVSWTHSFYGAHRDINLDLPGLERMLSEPEPTPQDRRDIDSLARRLRRLWHVFGDALPWLSRLIARPELRVTLAEVRRYLSNEDGIGASIREMLKTELQAAWQRGEPVMLICHSLGTVVAYESLWELSREAHVAGRVDWLITLGSPLGTRFIRRRLKGADLRGPARYPANVRRWLNVAARGEMTALVPRLEPLFGDIVAHGLCESLVDRDDVYNHFRDDSGLNVHKSYGYLMHEVVANVVADWLEETRGAPDGAG